MPAPTTPSAPDTSASDIQELVRLVTDLQSRVSKLEERLDVGVAVPAADLAAAAGPTVEPLETPVSLPGSEIPSNAVAVLGRVFLAVAGAFVLRALAEYGVIPASLGAGLGIIYALVWLFLATRLPAEAKFATAAACATSALIMIPLIWEASQRFKVLSSWTSAGLLAGFVLVSLAVSWAKRQTVISGVVGVSSALLAIVLMFANHDLLPFTLALLTIGLAMEVAAWLDHQTGARATAAIAADIAIFISSWLLSRPQGLPAEYVPISLGSLVFVQTLLMAIYLGSAGVQTVVRRRTLTFAEMAQTAAALLIGVAGIVWVFRSNAAVMLALGLTALAIGLACYAVSFRLFESVHMWNFRAWSAFGLFLVLIGTYFPFSGSAFWMLWCACAVGSCWAAMAVRRPTLGLHGAVYLLLGAVASDAAGQTVARLFGMGNDAFRWFAPLAVLLAAVVSWVAIAMSTTGESARWRKQVSSLAISSSIAWIAAGIAVQMLVSIWQAVAAGRGGDAPAYTLGTVVLTLTAAALAWAGGRWQKRELIWLAYAFMILGAYKLATRDFANEHSLALVVSLIFFGGVLVLMPRLQRGPRSSKETETVA
ncbi:MAG: hypothetical protein WBW33_37250 [Bryobacteraceae bacterium]